MCAKSRKSSAAVEPVIDRPFAADVLRRAAELARQYQVVLESSDGEWFGRGLELPGAMGDGKTPDKCVAATRDAMVSAVASMLEDGERPPTPAVSGVRSMQVNIRLTAEEKAILESAAHNRGFNGLSDFIRVVAMESVR
jgi:predicted RNase H-like HicB family nuclease